MNKHNLTFGIVGLIAGLVIGFFTANNINRSAPTTSAQTANANTRNPALPADHPPLGGEQNQNQSQGAPRPEVMQAIDRAKNNPDDYEAQMTAGDLYYQIQRYEDAAKFYEAATKLKPNAPEPLVKLGNSLFDIENYTEAERYYTLVLKQDPNNVHVRNDLGLTFFLREPPDTARAIKEFNAALALDPTSEIALQNLTLAYLRSGDRASLAATTDRLRKINPANPALKRAEGGQ